MAELFPTAVYLLCFLTSGACALLLGRGYRSSGSRLLFWSALCFVLLALNNLTLVIDLVVWPSGDLRILRHFFTLTAVGVLVFGFIWNGEE